MKDHVKSTMLFRARGLLMISAMLLCQACSGDEVSSANAAAPQEEQGSSFTTFTLSGAHEGDKDGVATMEFVEFSRGTLLSINLMDSENQEQSYRLAFRSESAEGGTVLAPGTYPIVYRPDAGQGYAGGFSATYTHIIENRGGYYANVALEYTSPRVSESVVGGELIIESVADGNITGTFELVLDENGSINNAPRGEDKQITVSNGRFRVAIPSEKQV